MPTRQSPFHALAFLVATAFSAAAWGQSASDNREVTVNYVYAVQLGIGGYRVDGLDVKAFSLPLAHTFDLDMPSDWRLKVKAPVSIGIYDFEATDTDGSNVSAYQETLAVIPGLELEIPATDLWTLAPFGNFGVGHGLRMQRQYAYIYSAGINSRIALPWRGNTVSIGNGVAFAGNATFGRGDGENYVAIRTGLDFRRPTGLRLFDQNTDIGLFAIHHYYPRPLVFKRFLKTPLTVRNQIEFGVSVGSPEPFEIFGIENPRLGVSYITGDGLDVFRINFGFPF